MPTDDRDHELTLGAALRAAREGAGLTVDKLSAETKIRATLIRDLEADELASSGGTVYARGHVKSIASSLHTESAPLLALFDRVAGAPAPLPLAELDEPVRGAGEFALSAAAAMRPERTGPRWGVAVVGAAAVLGTLIVIGQIGPNHSPARQTTLGAQSSSPSATPSVTRSQSPATQSPDLSASKPPVVGAQLRVRVIGGASWVSISNVSTTLFEGILSDGQFKDFHDAARLKVVIGNAPVVNLNCGGKDSGQAGPNNRKVRRFACTSTGLAPL